MAENNEDEKRAKEGGGEKSAKEAGAGAQAADAKKDKPDREQEKTSGSEKQAEAGDQDAGAVRVVSDRDPGIPPSRKKSGGTGRTQDTGLTSSEGAGQPRADQAPEARKEKDAA